MFGFMLILMTFVMSSAEASIHWVAPDQSIQSAVNSASDGDTVLIQDGVYLESTVIGGKLLTMGSEFLLDGDTTHIAMTEVIGDLDRPDTNSCFVYAHAEPIGGRLVGLTLSDGRGTFWSTGDSTAGGSVYVHFSSVSLEHCRFLRGSAYYGGGLFVYGTGPWFFTDYCSVSNCSFVDCEARSWGGAVYANYCSLRVELSVFESDTAVAAGGGVCAFDSYVGMDSCWFRHDFGEIGGMVMDGGRGHLQNTVFEHNGSIEVPEATHLFVGGSPLLVTRCVFRESDVSEVAVHFLGGGIFPTQFVGNLIEDNTATIHSGVIIFGTDVFGEVAYNVIRNNTSILGGVITANGDSHPRIHHNVFDGNVSLTPEWGAVFVSMTDADPELDSNIIIHHAPPLITVHGSNPVTIDARNNWWGDATGPYHPTLNPDGHGDSLLSDNVTFIPWLTEPPDTTMPQEVRERPEILRTWELAGLYPNPFNSTLRIILAGFTGPDFELTLHNMLGQLVDVIHLGAMTGGDFTYTAPAYLSSGVYFVKASDKRGMKTVKVVFLK